MNSLHKKIAMVVRDVAACFTIVFIWIIFVGGSIGKQKTSIFDASGNVELLSIAPLETIKARSTKLVGLLNPITNEFAFSVPISSFEGFNNALQKDHFNETYLESAKYPKATFVGKIIEPLPMDVDTAFNFRSKGIMTIHGISKERIIRLRCIVNRGNASAIGTFNVTLSDYNISIPKLVMQKIAPEIKITVNVDLKKVHR